MSRIFEMDLFGSFSYLVNSVSLVAVRMMSSSMLFIWRKSLFFFLKYPLPAKIFFDGVFCMTTGSNAWRKIGAVMEGSWGHFSLKYLKADLAD